MKKLSRNQNRLHRKKRIRAKINGTAKTPRLCVFRSLKRLEAQVIDDTSGKTLVSLDTKNIKAANDVKGAESLGQELAKKCLEKKIDKVVFDRSGYKFHGKVAALAEGTRKGGLKF